jgi:hypothetical protein
MTAPSFNRAGLFLRPFRPLPIFFGRLGSDPSEEIIIGGPQVLYPAVGVDDLLQVSPRCAVHMINADGTVSFQNEIRIF